MKKIGATPLAWGMKTECCGAALSITRTDMVGELCGRILDDAVARGAEAIIVACPMCPLPTWICAGPPLKKKPERNFNPDPLHHTGNRPRSGNGSGTAWTTKTFRTRRRAWKGERIKQHVTYGVFICHCGENISSTVDCGQVAKACATIPGVAQSVDYKIYVLGPRAKASFVKPIKEKNLTGVVVAACSPRMHEPTFRRVCAESGLNPFLCEMANLREQCSWVHPKEAKTTEKAIGHRSRCSLEKGQTE